MDRAKPFDIPKKEVWEAYKSVKAKRGAAGVDRQTITEFEADLADNLYKLWNRLSSGSYFPPPVRRVDIPKGEGKTRPLGIPTVADRIAQTVVKRYLEPLLEPIFQEDSFGYRPGISALDAVGVARQRCWRYDWVLDLDIKSFFDSIDRDKLMAAVRKHTDCRWVLLYIERWLAAPAQMPDGSMVERERGTPQGGVISPLLAYLFLHYAFDVWMRRNHPDVPFERYADDAICHCGSKAQADAVHQTLEKRFAECGLELHPEKTKIVYCKDDNRPGDYPNQSFDFLGYTFRPRSVRRRGKIGVGFTPAISDKARKRICETVRRWAVQCHSERSLEELAKLMNPALRGWIGYYGRFHGSALGPVFDHVNATLAWWASRKFKSMKASRVRTFDWLRHLRRREPRMFAHWYLTSVAGRTMGAV